MSETKTVVLEKKVLSKNDEIALKLRDFFHERSIYVVNLIGSPGSGKTTLLEALAPHFLGKAAVIEGDLQTDEDKRRIEKAGLPAYEINTIGACHLDAKMIQEALDHFPLGPVQFLFIENVGNLVCPSGFALGEDMKISIISVTEGDDKPIKYPTAIRASKAMVVTKTDLLPYIKCSVDRMRADAQSLNPPIEMFTLSATTGEGIEGFAEWLKGKAIEKYR